jgi:hypothetical protein
VIKFREKNYSCFCILSLCTCEFSRGPEGVKGKRKGGKEERMKGGKEERREEGKEGRREGGREGRRNKGEKKKKPVARGIAVGMFLELFFQSKKKPKEHVSVCCRGRSGGGWREG